MSDRSFVPIDALDDERVAVFRHLRDVSLWRDHHLFVVEGRINVEMLVRHGRFRTRAVLVTPVAREALRDLWGALPPEVDCFEASKEVLSGIVGFPFHRGCLAVAEREGEAELLPPARLLVALEDLTDLDNVGSAFRNALALGAGGVLLSPRCCDPLYRKPIRTSMGATLWLPYARAKSWPEDLFALRAAGYQIAALDPAAGALSIDTGAARLAGQRVVLVAGTEGDGLCRETREGADLRLRIPMRPGVDSINVATAIAIALQRLAPLAAEEPA